MPGRARALLPASAFEVLAWSATEGGISAIERGAHVANFTIEMLDRARKPADPRIVHIH